MKQVIYSLAAVICSVFFFQESNAQGMAVNNTGASAASSAMLDVSSTTRGVLVPRMSTSERDLIPSPATGLLIYQNDGTAGFYYYNGAAWTAISGGSGASSDHITNFTTVSTATYTVLTTDQLIYSTHASTVFTLPTAAAAGVGKTYQIIEGVTSYTNNAVKVATSSGDLIYSAYHTGGLTNTLSGYLSSGFGGITLVSNGIDKWYAVNFF